MIQQFAKVVSYPISVVKTDHVQDGAAMSREQGERRISVAINRLFDKSIRYLPV